MSSYTGQSPCIFRCCMKEQLHLEYHHLASCSCPFYNTSYWQKNTILTLPNYSVDIACVQCELVFLLSRLCRYFPSCMSKCEITWHLGTHYLQLTLLNLSTLSKPNWQITSGLISSHLLIRQTPVLTIIFVHVTNVSNSGFSTYLPK